MSLDSILDRLAGQPVIPRRKRRLRPARFHVEALEARALLTTYTVTSTNPYFNGDGGIDQLGLATAIAFANEDIENTVGGPAVIDFNIPGGDVQTISVAPNPNNPSEQALPTITRPVTIDGTTQPGSTPGHPMIDIDGSKAGDENGLTFTVGDNTVKGLVINNFQGTGIIIDGTNDHTHGTLFPNNVLQDNFIGTDSTGRNAAPNKTGGIEILNSSYNLIGGLNLSGQLTQGNLISGNGQNGLFLASATDTNDYIEGNFIGTDVTGLKPIANAQSGSYGVAMVPPVGALTLGYAKNNSIGDFDPVEQQIDPNGRNVISGNTADGVLVVGGTLNQISGNYIGVGADGKTPVANGQDGIRLEDASSNTVGGTTTGAGNVISGNSEDGLEIVADAATDYGLAIPVSQQGASSNKVEGNLIGTDLTGKVAVPNGNSSAAGTDEFGEGIALENLATDPLVSVSSNTIGGINTNPGGALSGGGNLISGNWDDGILMLGKNVSVNTVEGNYIGADITGQNPLDNTNYGVELNHVPGQFDGGPSANIIGSAVSGGGNLISGNGTGIQGNTPGFGGGVGIEDLASANLIQNNLIGTDATGLKFLPNADGGVFVGGNDNTIGGTAPDAGNVISGNSLVGVNILSGNGNMVQKNLIGVGLDDVTPLPNAIGVDVSGSGNVIGGVQTVGNQQNSLGNVISANTLEGIELFLANSTQVLGNMIGTDLAGKANLGNGEEGILIEGSLSNTIGGTTTAARNLIVFNHTDGIDIEPDPLGGQSSGNVIEGDFIGIGPDGITPEANVVYGIDINNSSSNTIGGPANAVGQAPGNLIDCNGFGIYISNGQKTVIQGNQIASNTGDGVRLVQSSSNNQIGGNTSTAANEIVLNGGIGISIEGGSNNTAVVGNDIGTDLHGTQTLGNKLGGIDIENVHDNTIGGPANVVGQAPGNLIEYNGNTGIIIDGAASQHNHVVSNVVGSNAAAGIALQNGATNNFIGEPGAGNTIILNQLNGVLITDAGTSQNQVQSNHIGIDDPDLARGNLQSGVLIDSGAHDNIIGGTTAGAGNVISANLVGIQLQYGTAGNSIAGNFIGTGLNGTFHTGLGNTTAGIVSLAAGPDTIGGPAITPGSSPGNKILGNAIGIVVQGGTATDPSTGTKATAHGNTIQGNEIANSDQYGIKLYNGASGNQIGGSADDDANSIHDNGSDGVYVNVGAGNSIRHNPIFNNTGLGIHLDQNNGGNNLQASPLLSLATTGGSHRLTGSMTGAPNTTYTLEFFTGQIFQNSDGSENDDAEKLIVPFPPTLPETGVAAGTSVWVTTNVDGVCLFDLNLPNDTADGTIIRATATDPNGNTSQFSNAAIVSTDTHGVGVPDAYQNGTTATSSSVTFPDALSSGAYISLQVTTPGVSVQNVWSTIDPAPFDRNGPPSNLQFGLGFFSFVLTGVPAPPTPVEVTLTLPSTPSAPLSYWRYGKTPDNQTDHWYNWIWDGDPNHTGAEINGDTITLHLIDGAKGDDDTTVNRVIVDPGGPAFPGPYTVSTTADSGPGSLRQAILNANGNPGSTITFDLPGTGPQTIQLLAPLPAITAGVTIDGSTEPGFAVTPLVVLDGSSAGAGADGLTVASGFATIQDLVINHFSGDGIHVLSGGSALIAGNFIGTDASGKTAEGNGRFGVEIEKVTNDPDNDGDDDIKGDNADTDNDATGSGQPSTIDGGNVISGNLAGGISIHGALAKNDEITNNFIGTQADGVSPLGNGGPGVVIDGGSNGNMVGSQPKTGNTIAFNAGPGVEILKGIDNLIESNSIFANQGLGIELASGGNANESQSAPVLASAASYGGETFVSGTLTSTPNSSYKIDFYATDQADQSGGSQGQSLLGSVTITTDNNGQASFDATLAASATSGSFITATASLNDNETSAFSGALALTPTNPMVLIVNTGSDTPDADCGLFTLRQAIAAANANPGQDTIDFDLPNSDRVILPQSPLPAITDPVIIDGTSQPGYQGLPLVEIDGSQAGAGADGLHITGGGSIVRGLAIHSLSGNGVELSGPGGNVIEGNFLGTDVTGTSAMRDAGEDVFINGSPDNLIGGTTAAARNVILALDVTGRGATGNRIEGNYIGTDLTGTALLSDPGQVGVEISASSNTIGGLAAGDGNVIERSLGIQNASNNVVQGNLIGTDVTGTVYLSANTDLGGVGILGTDNTSNFSSNNLIGGTTAAARNIIAGGVNLTGADVYNLVQGNYIGTDTTGTVSLGAEGVFIDQTSSNETPAFNTIGGAEPGAGNLISGLNHTGISLTGDTHNNTIQGNRIGTDVTGTKALDNIGYGIDDGGYDDTIGGDLPGEGNLISGNEQGGIILRSRGAGGDVVEGNLIGTDYTGTIAIGNGYGSNAPNGDDDGIDVGENNATIGGPQPGAGNVISDSSASGIAVEGGTGLVIQGNFIGTDLTGTKALGNRGDGITVDNLPVLNSVIGGTSPGAGNVISGNGGDGIHISDPLLLALGGQISSGNIIQGNKIGTDVTGTRDLGNAGDGVSVIISNLLASEETVGGTDPGAGNTIAFNGGRGVDIPFGNGNTVRGNDIFDNAGPGLITDINAAASTYAENRGIQLSQAPPVLSSAVFDPRGTVVSGALRGTPFTRYDIDFFANDKVNATGFGDGQTYLQSISALVDNTGSVQFQIPLDAAVPIGQWITATATPAPPPSGPIPIPEPNTSLFSQGVPVVAAIDASDIQFSAPTYLVTETGGSALIVVTRSGDTSGTAKVDYATRDGSAAAGVNYTTETGTLTFAPSVTSQAITVPLQDDGLANGNKVFQILLSNVSGANLGAINTADVTVADSDSAGKIQFSSPTYFEDKALTLNSANASAIFTLTRTGGSEGTTSVEYRVTGGTAGSMDYQDNFGTATFAPGQTTAQILFGYALASVYRGPQTLQVTIGNPTGGAVLGQITTSVVTIDDPEDQNGAFEIKSQSQVKENAGQAAIEVDRLGQSSTTEKVSYSTVDDTAKAGTNFIATSGTLTFQPGQTQAEIDVSVLDDHLNDNPGTFQVVLSDPTGGAFIFDGLGHGNVTILNSDVSPPSDILVVETINNAGNSGGFIENSGTALITVARVNPVTGQPDGGGTAGVVQVNYATSDGTAQAGSDYTAESGTLFFGPGQAYAHFSVPILPGHDFPDTRTFLVTLSNAVGDAVISADNPVTETIYGIAGRLDITSPTYTVGETKAALTVTVALNRLPGENGELPIGNVTVDYATHDGTATAGADYTAVSGTLTFSERDVAPLLQATITIPILNDQLLESNAPTFDLTLSNPTGGPTIGTGTAQITILEDGDAQLSQVPSTTTVTSSAPNGSTYGQSITFTATVSATSGTPSGAVDFVDTTTGQDLATVPLTVVDCDGEASLNVSSLDVGSHTIVAHYTGDTANLAVSQGSVTQLVTPATLTIKADPKTMAFGTTVPGLTDTITGFVNGDTASVVSGAASLNTTAASTSGVGNYPITAGQGTLDAANYTFRILGSTLSIVPAKLTLTLVADNETMVYGSTVPALTDRIVGFVNGDTASVVSGAPSITTTATSASGVGTYPIDVSLGTLSAADYTFAFLGGTLTVTPATLTVTAGSATKVYGATVPALTDTITDFVNGDTASVVSGAASLSTNATSASGVGIYANMVALGTLSAANYTFAFADGTTTVTPAMLTVTADNKTQVYGAANPPLTDTITGFIKGDTSNVVSGMPSLSTAATTASGVGSYAITVAAGTLSATNYTFALLNGSMSVTPATLTVTADDKTMISGATVPALTDTITGFVNGDTSSVVTGAASLSTAATPASGAGDYPIEVGAGTLIASNYTFTFVNGTLAIAAGSDMPVLTLVHDAPASATEGSSATLSSSVLETNDSDSSVSPSTIVYTITAAPTLGTLADDGIPLASGDTFSQQDIHDGLVTYQSTEEGADSFTFGVASGAASPITGTLAITASDPAVVTTGGFTYSVTADTTGIAQTVATFTDPGGAEALVDYAATIDWGDGTSATSGTLSVDPNTHVFTVSGAHTYAHDGTFGVAITIVHETAVVTVTSTASIASATGTGEGVIAASGLAVSGYEFSALTGVTLATFTDTNVSLGASDLSAIINWGDGTTSAAAVVVSSGVAGGTRLPEYAVTGSHEYVDEGQYTIKVSIEQTAEPVTGGTSATVSATATIHEERLANGTAGTPDQKYIQEIYRDLFGRQAEMQGLDFWVAELAQGVPRQQVAFRMVKIAYFEEFQHDTVAALYKQYLGRAADAGGLAYWSAYLYDGGTIEGMSQALVNSPEYWQKRGAGAVGGFLNALFQDALGRAIEPAAASYFESRMSNGWSAADVAAAVFTSDEYHRLRVNALFEQFTGRPADPGALAYFAGELDDGDRDEIIISQLLASDEYFGRSQL